MVRLCVPVVPPAHTAEGLQITTMEVCTRRDAEALLTTGILVLVMEMKKVRKTRIVL